MAEVRKPPPATAEEELPKMSLGDHLDELRRRLLISLLALVVCVFGIFPFKNTVTAIYVAPYQWMWQRAFADYRETEMAKLDALGGLDKVHPLERRKYEFLRQYGDQVQDGTLDEDLIRYVNTDGGFQVRYTLVALGGLEDFWTFMAATMLFAVALAAPIVLYQAWAFIAAGLYQRERRVVLRYFPFAVVLLISGVTFGYAVVVPWGLYFLINMMNFLKIEPLLSVAQYFSFLLTLTVALGAVFQLPLVMLALQKVGIVTFDVMAKNWRYVILIMFIASALLTPPDPFTQCLMALPMVGLYLLGLLLCWRASKLAPKMAGIRA